MARTRSWGRRLAVIAALVLSAAAAAAVSSPADLAEAFAEDVDRRLQVPPQEADRYAALAERAFAQAYIRPEGAQYLVVVDRDPEVQALLLFWRSAEGQYRLVGSAPVSTGNPGSFDHFATPVGVFDHGPWTPDFRAEGTFNSNGIRGFGVKGMRVFDFGWQRAPKGWGDGAVMEMRLLMHATDPDALERRLGSAQSKGCVRIPASLDRLLDHYGVLDAEYERLVREGHELWVLDPARQPVADAGRYLVVVDSARDERPQWSPPPAPLPRRALR
ncbi:L,D-transpeptidase [Ramlibacter sp. AN1133]|uniref:L,D-transpeptidase n=1 Tax=Ramlibacter sp. AN1133 TaxID=3133429 RepID=UPI0030BA8A11